MNTSELQQIVTIEAISLLLICTVILAAFKRWKWTLIISSGLATIAFFTVWSWIMALGSLLVYGPASTLLWIQLHKNKKDKKVSRMNNFLQSIYWILLAGGVLILILNNTHNIFIYLS